MLTISCFKALRHIRQIAQETSGEVVYALGRQPAVLRTFSQRLSRLVLANDCASFACVFLGSVVYFNIILIIPLQRI
jgi:hypothetical protein